MLTLGIGPAMEKQWGRRELLKIEQIERIDKLWKGITGVFVEFITLWIGANWDALMRRVEPSCFNCLGILTAGHFDSLAVSLKPESEGTLHRNQRNWFLCQSLQFNTGDPSLHDVGQ